MSGSLTIRELINLFGFEVDEASFNAAEDAVGRLEQVLVNATASASRAAVEVSGLVEQLGTVGREAANLGAFNSVLAEWTKSTADATKRLALMKEEAKAAEQASEQREVAARAAEAQAKESLAAARAAELAVKEQVALSQAAEQSGKKASTGFRDWLNVLADVNQALQLAREVAATISAPVLELVERARQLNTQANLLGVSTGRLQEWQYAIAAVGGEADELGESLLDLADKMDDAQSGEGEYAELFKRLGTNVKDAHTGKLKPLESFLPELADAFSMMTNETERAGLASRLMGETGAKVFLPMFAKGSAGIAQLTAEARAMGAVLGDDTIKQTLAFREELGRTDAIVQSLKYELGGALLPAVRDILMAVRTWVAENRQLLSSGFDVAMKLFSGAARVVVQVGEPLLRLLKFLAVDGGRWKLVLAALTLALLYYAGTAIMGAVGSTWSLTAAIGQQVWTMGTAVARFAMMTNAFKLLTLQQQASAITAAAAPYLIAAAWAALVILLGLMLEDIYVFFEGGDSIFGRWGEWILDVLAINPTDSGLVKFLKWLGMLLFDTVGAVEMAGDAIGDAWDTLVDGMKARIDQVVTMAKALFDLFLGAPARALAAFLSGDITGGLEQLRSNVSTENLGNVLNAVQEGLAGFKMVDFSPERYVGRSASPAAALAASVYSGNSNVSSVFSPSQQLVQHINVGANATPQEAARASGDGMREAFLEMLKDASFTAGNG